MAEMANAVIQLPKTPEYCQNNCKTSVSFSITNKCLNRLLLRKPTGGHVWTSAPAEGRRWKSVTPLQEKGQPILFSSRASL